jgi:hypothetical protein
MNNKKTNSVDDKNTRLILFHKHPVSARMNFMYFQYGGVCGFEPLPRLSALVESDKTLKSGFHAHPAVLSAWGEEKLGISRGALSIEAEFCETVEVPTRDITVYLAGLDGYEIPDPEKWRYPARSRNLLECVGLPPVEMLLLQRAYTVVMGGHS